VTNVGIVQLSELTHLPPKKVLHKKRTFIFDLHTTFVVCN